MRAVDVVPWAVGPSPYAGAVNSPVSLHDVTIEKLVAGGDGLARLADGRIVFVPAVAPGETVTIEMHETRRDFGRARLVSVNTSSNARRLPPCPQVAAGCGGCDWQHIDPAAQSDVKRDIVIEAFARTARMEIDPVLHRLPESARRTTVRMVSDGKGGLGFRAGESHEIVPAPSCAVAHDLINEFISGPVLEGAGEVTIRVGARTGDVGVFAHDGALSRNLRAGVKTGERGTVRESVAGREYAVSMGSFFQSSPEAAELIIESVGRALDVLGIEGGSMLDAYGGVGLFSLAFAQRFDELVLVESSPHACRDAVRNLAECAAVIEQSDMDHWEPMEVDVVVADPSRQGLGKLGAAAVVDTGAPTIVLVSCDPVAGARDARLLASAGYELQGVEVLDIFPETHHVEVVSTFSRASD